MRCARHGQRCAVPPPTVSCDLGIFRVGRPIGRGGFATVYALVDHPLALKVVSKCSNRDATRAEAAIHKLLNHPSIVRFRASWEDDSRIFILMDRVPGFCLADIVREAPLTEAAARVYAANLLEALSYMHANGIIHRDVKLANLLVTHDRSRAVLCDFGLAVHVSALEGMPHAVCGTPTYVAPEVLELRNPAPDNTQESQLNARPRVGHTRGADAWSAGVVIYSMLIGRGPFDTDDVGRTFRKIRAARFTFPSKMRLSAEAKDLIRSLLTENPAARPTMDQALKHPFFTSWSLSSESRLSSISSDSRGKEGQERPREDRAEDNPRPIGTRKRDISNRFGRAETRRWYGRPRRDSDLGLRHEAYSNMDERTTAFHEGKSSDSSSSAFSPSPYLADRPRSTVITERRSGAVPQTPRVRCHSAINSSSVESSTLYGDGHYDSKAPVQRTRISTPKRRPLISQMSLIVSAATLRGRKLLDDDVKRTGGHTSTQRFDAVAIPVECDNSGKGDYPPPLVRRWLDYTSKYGFATLMEDGRAGCCFNDGSLMFFLSNPRAKVPDVVYASAPANYGSEKRSKRRTTIQSVQTSEELQANIARKARLCALFSEMMLNGGRGSMYELPSACNVSFLTTADSGSEDSIPNVHGDDDEDDYKQVHVREWQRYRSPYSAAAFRLNNNSIHVKIEVGEERCDDFLFDAVRSVLFYRESRGTAWECPLNQLAEFSTRSEKLYNKLELCRYAIARFAQ